MSFAVTNSTNLPPLPLPLYSHEVIADIQIGPFGDGQIVAGLSPTIVEQLCIRSNDPTDKALALTNDQTRFASKESTEAWYMQGRMPFALLHTDSQDLMAIVWIGPKPLGVRPHEELVTDHTPEKSMSDPDTENWDTVSYRSYPPYRGGGFMTKYVGYILSVYQTHYPDRRLWVGINRTNSASQALAQKLGFTPVDVRPDETDRVVMILA